MKSSGYILDIIGTIMVLASLSVEFVFEKRLDESANGYRTYLIEQRLDNIWGLLAHQYSHNPSNHTESIIQFNYDYAARSWPHLTSKPDPIETQRTVFAAIRFWSFMLGSILILVGKILEIPRKTEQPLSPR